MNLVRGKHIQPKNEKEFQEIQKSLGNFTGVMQLFGKVSGEFCQADLLIEKGNLIAASFENLEKGELYLAENALAEIKNNFIEKSKEGRLELYEFNQKEIEEVKKLNNNSKLHPELSLKSLGLTLRPHQPKEVKESKDKRIFFQLALLGKEEDRSLDIVKRGVEGVLKVRSKEKVEKEKPREGIFPLIARVKEEEPKEVKFPLISRMRKVSKLSSQEDRWVLLEKLARRKEKIDRKIAERISKLFRKKLKRGKEKKIKRVRTSIDDLYEAIKKNKRLKISTSLANRFGVTKSQLENWAIILEEHGLVEIHYPAIGEPEIIKK